jgi:hypothetical protein
MKRKLISMRCRYIMGHPEIKEKIPVRLYREGADIVIIDRDRAERGRIPLDRVHNLGVETKAVLAAALASARPGTLRNPGVLGGGRIRLRDRMLLIDWRLPNNCLITTVFEYSGIFARLKAEIADSEFRKIMHEIRPDGGK